MRMLRFVVYGALALAVADRAVASGAGATVLQEIQAPDLSRRHNFSPNSVDTFVVSADLRPSPSVLRPANQRPAFSFPQQQPISRPPPPSQAAPQSRPQSSPQQQPISRPPPPSQAAPQSRPQSRPQPGQNTGPKSEPQIRLQVNNALQKPATSAPVLDKATVEVREINPPFLQQYNEDGTIYRPPPPTAPPPPPPQPQRPPPRFRRPRPPFGRPALPRPGRPLRPRPPSFPSSLQQLQRPRPPSFPSSLQQLQQRIFGQRPARVAPHRRRSRRDLSSDDEAEEEGVTLSPDVKQDRLGKWEMEYAMRKAADPASLRDEETVPLWAPLKPEARARLAQLVAEPFTPPADERSEEITVTEVIADGAETAHIPISAGDEVVIVRVPEERPRSQALSIEPSKLLSYRDGRARRVDDEAVPKESTGRSDQSWWASIPLLSRLVYRQLPGEETTPLYTPKGKATAVGPTERAGYDPDSVSAPHYDPYLSVDSSGRPYYRTPIQAQQAHFERIPDVVKPVLNPTDDFVVPDNLEDPFRGGYAPFRPGYQYVPHVPYFPSPYYPDGDVKYHRRQQLFPTELEYLERTDKKRDGEGAEVKARQTETVLKADVVEPNESDVGRVLAQAAQGRTGKISILDTGDHYAIISGDINKFVDFDDEKVTTAKSTKARSLADLLKISESSYTASAPHKRTKRQSGLYPLLAPVRRRPQRRPVQRRDDVGRFPPRVPVFRPPWESGRRAPGRSRGPQSRRPVPQRPSALQPTTGFQPPVPRPAFGARPFFDQQQDTPNFNQQEETPSFEQHNSQPAYEQPHERPIFEPSNDWPSFEQPAARPEFEQPGIGPTFHEPASRPTVEQPGNAIITGPKAQFGGFQPVKGPANGADLQLSGTPVAHEAPLQQQPVLVASPVRQDVRSRTTVVTTVPTTVHTAAFHVSPSRAVHRPIQPVTRVATEQQLTTPQQQFASSQRHQQVVVSSSISQPPVADNQVTEDAGKPSGSWASAALAGLTAILGGSSEAAPETNAPQTTEIPTPDDTNLDQDGKSHGVGGVHQRNGNVPKPKNSDAHVTGSKTLNITTVKNGENQTRKEEQKGKPATKVLKRYRKRQRRPSSSATASSTTIRRNTSRRANSPTVVHRRRRPTVTPTAASDGAAAAADVKPAAATAPKRRVAFGARVRPAAGQRRRRPTASEPKPIPAPATSSHEPVTAEASPSVRRPVIRLPSKATVTEGRVETSMPPTKKRTQSRRTSALPPSPTLPTTQPTPTPTTEEPKLTETTEQQGDVSVEVPSAGGFRPVSSPPLLRPDLPSRTRPALHQFQTPVVPHPNNVENVPPKTHQEESRRHVKVEEEDEEEDVHSQLESYLSRYAEKYGLGLVTSSPSTPRPTPDGRPAAPVSGLRWAHLAARSRSPSHIDTNDELDEFVTGEADGDERVSVGSQYSYRVQLPPSRRVPPALNSVRLRPKSKLAQLLGSSPRLRPSTPKPTIPWPAGFQPFRVSSTTTRPSRWAARRERLTTPAPAPTAGPAWSKYADEFTTTTRPTTQSPVNSGSRSRPIFIPPINRKRVRTRPLTLQHAGTRRPETTASTEQTSIIRTEEPTEGPAVTVPAPPPVTKQISLQQESTSGADDVEYTTDSGVEDEKDPLVASSEEPVGESSLFSVVYSKERPHVPPPQPEIFSRLNQFLVAHGEQPPTAPASISVAVGTSPIRVPVSAPVDSQREQGGFQASIQVVPVNEPIQGELDKETEQAEEQEREVVTAEGAVIVQAMPADASQPASNGNWVPTTQVVALEPVVAADQQPGTVVVYPEHMSQAERETQWPAQTTERQPEEEKEDDSEWFEEPESVHDLELSDDGLLEEVVYIENENSGAVLGKAARLDDEAASEAEILASTADDEPVEEDTAEVARPVLDPYNVFWTSPSGATNAEQAESQQLAGAFAAVQQAAEEEGERPSESRPELSDEVDADDDRTVNLCLDGKCMFIYEPGRQVRVSGDN